MQEQSELSVAEMGSRSPRNPYLLALGAIAAALVVGGLVVALLSLRITPVPSVIGVTMVVTGIATAVVRLAVQAVMWDGSRRRELPEQR